MLGRHPASVFHRTRFGPALALLAMMLTAAAAKALPTEQASEPFSSQPLVLKIGYTTFENPRHVVTRQATTLQSITKYLSHLSQASERDILFRRPVQFDLYLGNYYQILAWVESGALDGAVVSPFVAFLLREKGLAEPVVEFSEGNHLERTDWSRNGHWPLIAGAGNDAARNDPVRAYTQYLDRLRELVEDEPATCLKTVRGEFQINMVAHLSSSGFIAPTLYAERYVTDRGLRPGLRQAFWQCFFDNAALRFDHAHKASAQRQAEPPVRLYFSYSGRASHKLRKSEEDLGTGAWSCYDYSRARSSSCVEDAGAPPIPNDVLVLRTDFKRALLVAPEEQFERSSWQLDTADAGRIFGSDSGYSGVAAYASMEHAEFATSLREAFFKVQLGGAFDRLEPINAIFYRWFEEGRYEFSVEEIFDLLVKDQISSDVDHVALVLPGGGVKSAYQAKMLDVLYRSGDRQPSAEPTAAATPARLANGPGPAGREPGLPLRVREVVGTSGGAMVGLFAAQKSDDTDPDLLTDLWLKDGEVQTSSDSLFPALDMLRWISIFMVLAIFVACFYGLRLLRLLRPAEATDFRPSFRTPLRVWFISGAVLLAAPVLVARLRLNPEDRLTEEGILFFLATALCHFAVSCIGLPEQPASPGARKGRALWPAGAAASALLAAAAVLAGTSAMRTLLAVISAVVAILSLLAYVASPASRVVFRCRRLYLESIGRVVLILLTSFAVFFLFCLAGRSTFLEITIEYWLWLALSTVIASTAALLLAAKLPVLRLRQAAGYLSSSHVIGGLRVERGLALVLLFGAALAWWNFVIAPAIYEGGTAKRFFRQRVAASGLAGAPGPAALQATLIVTASNVEPLTVDERLLEPGDIYFCFAGAEPCPAALGRRWFSQEATPETIVDPVFASGSPFPVFPPNPTELPEQNEQGRAKALLIDGGYTHNVPLEAAALAGARQVLVVRSEPDTEMVLDRSWFPSQLARYGLNLVSFLFGRAQEIDRGVSDDLFVASLVPRPRPSWPWLADFRRQRILDMVDFAQQDLENRIGVVESWGPPQLFRKIRAGRVVDAFEKATIRHLRLDAAGWDPVVRAALMKRIVTPGQQVAVFDFDNTCIRNDLGEAVFLRLIVDGAFRGDDERLWRLIPDVAARQKLRALWEAHGAAWRQAERRIDDWRQWEPEFLDFVVLFYRQYDALLEAEGAATAYPWVVRLFVGMTPEQVERLTSEVWARERSRGIGLAPVLLESPNEGSVEIARGLAPFPQIEELIQRVGPNGLGWHVLVVTASSEYSVRAVAPELGVPAHQVLGIRLHEDSTGRLTDRIRPPVTYRPGKVERLDGRLREIGLTLADVGLVAGDSMTDLEMLRSTRNLALLIDRGKIADSELETGFAPGVLVVRQPVQGLLDAMRPGRPPGE